MNTLVSVYVPTKDRCALLQRAVNSVLAQTHREFELIVVNDGSSDGTAAYLDALAADDPRVRVFHCAKPSGAPHARNLAIRAARGEWVTGLDDDDEFMPERLAALVAIAAAFESGGVPFSGLYTQDEVVRPARTSATRKPCCVTLEALFMQNCIGNQVFMRRSVAVDLGLYDERLPAWQDLDFNMRLVDRHGPARLVDRALYRLYHDDRPDRLSRQRKPAILEAFRLVSGKWPAASARQKQQLYLQVLSTHYGFPIEPADIARYASFGVGPGAMARLMRQCTERLRRRRA